VEMDGVILWRQALMDCRIFPFIITSSFSYYHFLPATCFQWYVAQCTEHTAPAAPTMRAIALLVLFLAATQGASIANTTLPQQLQVRQSRIDG
jgi:hypothetical protein